MKIDIHNNLIEFGSLYLKNHTVFDVEGENPKVEEFLQGQVTSDISLLSNNCAQLSCICNHKGEIMADFIIIKKNMKYKFIVENVTGLDSILIEELTPFAKFSNVKFKKTDDIIVGTISPKGNSKESFLSNDFCELSITISSDKNLKDSINISQWEAANKILGNLFLEHTDAGKYRPLEINYDKLRVSFDKGCYRGQEIVARMKYLGVDRRKFCTFVTEDSFFNQFKSWVHLDPETKRVSINKDSAPAKKDRPFNIVGRVININNRYVFNAIVKKDDLSKLNDETPGILAII